MAARLPLESIGKTELVSSSQFKADNSTSLTGEGLEKNKTLPPCPEELHTLQAKSKPLISSRSCI